MNILNDLEFREDGRTNKQLRRIIIDHGNINNNGYVMFRQGNSCVRVICNGPKEGNRVFFHIKFSKTSRQEPINEKRLYNYEDVLQKIFDDIILVENQLDIDVDVIQEDGSLVSVMVNCIFMCLCYTGVALLDSICSVTLSEHFIDLSTCEENRRNGTVILVYSINRNQFVYVRCTGRIIKDELEKIFDAAREVSSEVFSYMKKYLLSINSHDKIK